jgi:hypothetical protein
MRSLWGLAITVFLLVLTTGTVFGQRVHIVGSLARHTFLRVAATPREVQVANQSAEMVNLHVRPASGVSVIPLIARSNIAYRLTAQGSEGLQLRVTAVKPLAGTEHLRSGAATALVTRPVALTRFPQTILEGSRISNGGNDSTTDNALLIQVEVAGHESDADLTLLMVPAITQ